MLQLLGDHTPPKHQHTHTHTQSLTHTQLQHTNQLSLTQTNLHTPNWDMFSPIPANHTDSSVEQAATNRSSLIDTTYSQRGSGSPSPLRSMTPDPQLPVVTDASILNLTSLSRYVCSMITYVTGDGHFFSIQFMVIFQFFQYIFVSFLMMYHTLKSENILRRYAYLNVGTS